jgi:hypothetical protein
MKSTVAPKGVGHRHDRREGEGLSLGVGLEEGLIDQCIATLE